MKILLIHADYLEYKVESKTKVAEEISEELKTQRTDEVLVAFIAVEKADEEGPEKAVKQASEEITSVYGEVKAKNIFIYPYAHLSSSLAKPNIAVKILKDLEALLKEKYPVKRAPFGWYKSFQLSCKGHPLSELSREIVVSEVKKKVSEAVKAEKKIERHWFILHKGKLMPASEFDFSNYQGLKIFYEYETSGTRAVPREPPHIKLMQEHELVDYEPGSDSGNMRWYPKGELIKQLLEEHVTSILTNYGAMQVETPIMYDIEHPQLSKYLDRFPARQYIVKSEDKEYFLRFAACFGQYLIKHDMTISYKHLPLKLYELTHYSFRREQKGELAGLKRLRTFTMPDMHTLCRDMEQAKQEFINQYKLSMKWMSDIGLDYDVAMRFVKDFYYENEDFARELADIAGKPILVELWDKRFFYFVMKFEFSINDALNKAATLSTVQIDAENTERFDISYVDEDGSKKHPLMLHASISGGIDRNLYAMLENEWLRAQQGEKPMLPLWLSPTQVRIIPVAESHLDFCAALLSELENSNIRADLDDESYTLDKKIRSAEKEWVPYIAVIGGKEIESRVLTVRVRSKGGKQEKLTKEELIERIKKETAGKPFKKLSLPSRLSKRPRFR
ncbi:MAG: threonine--tRNA ligase [Candidatus Hydrothermarchaeota archaeon]|nr:threonine--tRNA ligase [Candidatus Hydrothermarchaeota archaeon]